MRKRAQHHAEQPLRWDTAAEASAPGGPIVKIAPARRALRCREL